MKKIIFIGIFALLVSCDITSSQEDREILQKQFNTVYPLENNNENVSNRYICIDFRGNVYDVTVNYDGSIFSKIKIK